MKIYTLRAAVKSTQINEIDVEVESPKKKAPQRDDSLSKGWTVVLTALFVFLALLLWYCTAILTFGARYGHNNPSVRITCETCSQCPVHPYDRRGEIKTRTYYNKNRVTPREFNARFWGAMFFQKYPELKEQAKPEWTLYRDALNEPYHKWAVKPKTRGWYHGNQETLSNSPFRGADLTDPCEFTGGWGCPQAVHFFFAAKNSRHRGAR